LSEKMECPKLALDKSSEMEYADLCLGKFYISSCSRIDSFSFRMILGTGCRVQ
jgi:hypothetical protein